VRNGFWKGHGLGNDYLVVDPSELDFPLGRRAVRALCERNTGVGADGVLARAPSRVADFGVRIYNPDGSEAEKSGNGLRIFARFLHANGHTRKRSFSVETRGGVVRIELLLDAHGDAARARVEMGRASFRPSALPCRMDVEELLDVPIRVDERPLRFTGVSVGNPHCVLFRERGRGWSERELRELGPRIERHTLFPKRVNVQLAVPRGPHALDVLVWERGAGETRASGTSACAAASAAVRLGHVKSPVGVLEVAVSRECDVLLSGPVEEVARGRVSDAFARSLA
jgi:diaminopimelate epimerase